MGKKTEGISEECFQRQVLRFASNVSWLQYSDLIPNREGYIKLPRFEIPLVTVSEHTFPPGSEWARNPIPSCAYCDQTKCGTRLPNMTEWFEPHQVRWRRGVVETGAVRTRLLRRRLDDLPTSYDAIPRTVTWHQQLYWDNHDRFPSRSNHHDGY